MKKLVLAIGMLIASFVAASAACVPPAVMHDFPGTAFSMSMMTNTTDSNCASNVDAAAGGHFDALFNLPVPLGSATNGLSTNYQDALLATVVAVDASAGQLYELYCYNPNAAVSFVQLFDLATGSVTLGTTVPKLSYGIPPATSAGFTVSLVGAQFATAISTAATTTSKGSTAPGAGLTCNFKFK